MTNKNYFKMPKLPDSISSLLLTEREGCILSVSQNGLVHVYPTSYYADGCNIYFGTPKESKKMEFLNKSSSLAFSVDNKKLTNEAKGVMFHGQAEIFDSKDIIGEFKALLPSMVKYSKEYPELDKFFTSNMDELPIEREFYYYRVIVINPTKIVYWQGYQMERINVPEEESFGLLSRSHRGKDSEVFGENAYRFLNIFKWIDSSWNTYKEGKMIELSETFDLEGIGNYGRLIQTTREKALMDGIISSDEEQLLDIIERHSCTFEQALNDALADGIMTKDEFTMLKVISNVIYKNVLEHALKDGELTEDEKTILDAIKKEFKMRPRKELRIQDD